MSSKKTGNFVVVLVMGLALVMGPVAFNLVGQAIAFDDVEGHWAEEAILNLHAQEIVQGYNATEFLPNRTITRSEAAALLVSGLRLTEQARVLEKVPSSYRDVPNKHWAKGFIEAAREYGLMQGYGDNSFEPDRAITREEIVMLLVKMLELLPAGEKIDQALVEQQLRRYFVDSAVISSWAKEGVLLARDLDLVIGYTDGAFRPGEPATRAQAVQLLNRALVFQGQGYQFYGIIQGGDPALNRLEILVDRQLVTLPVVEKAGFFDRAVRGDWRDLLIFTPVFFNLNRQGEIAFLTTADKNYLLPRIEVKRGLNILGLGGENILGEKTVNSLRDNIAASVGQPVEKNQSGGSGAARLTPEVTGELMQVPRLRESIGASGQGIKVALVDSGIDPGHPDLLATPAGKSKIHKLIDLTDEGLVLTSGSGIKRGILSLPGLLPSDLTVVVTGRDKRDYRVYLSKPGDNSLTEYLELVGEETFSRNIANQAASGKVAVLGNQGYGEFDREKKYISVPLSPGTLNLAVAEIGPEGSWVKFFFDGNGHGTHVAGIIGANGTISGIAPGVELIVVKALDSFGESDVDTIKQAVKKAVESGADLVNLSLGYHLGPGELGAELVSFIEELSLKNNIPFIVAAGNNGPGIGTMATPGSGGGVITVGAYIAPVMWEQEYGFKLDGEILHGFSSVGPGGNNGIKPDVLAPGVVRSTFPLWAGTGLNLDEGTSMATPHVTGLLALILEGGRKRGNSYSPQALKEALHRGAKPIAGLSLLEQGYGKVDGLAAWQSLLAGPKLSSGEVEIKYLLSGQPGDIGDGPGYLYLRQFAPGIVNLAVTNQGDREQQVRLASGVPWLNPRIDNLRLPPKSTRIIPVYFQQVTDPVGEQGVKVGLLTGATGSGQKIDLVSTMITSPAPSATGQLTREGRLGAGQLKRYFIRVDENTDTLSISLRVLQNTGGNPLGRARIHLFDPTGMEWQVSPYIGAEQRTGQYKLADTIRVDYPEPGVWEVVVASSTWLDFYGLKETRYMLSLYTEMLETWQQPDSGKAEEGQNWVVGVMPRGTVRIAGQEQVLWLYNRAAGQFYQGPVLVNDTLYQAEAGRLVVHSSQLSQSKVTIQLLEK